MNNTITIQAPLRRYGGIIINLAEVAEARLDEADKAVILMRSGNRYQFPKDIAELWFADIADFGKETTFATGKGVLQ